MSWNPETAEGPLSKPSMIKRVDRGPERGRDLPGVPRSGQRRAEVGPAQLSTCSSVATGPWQRGRLTWEVDTPSLGSLYCVSK